MEASPRRVRETTAVPNMAASVPPSFGQPGIKISFRPKPMVAGAAATPSLQDYPLLTVTVPPASIHHIFNHRQWRAGMLMSDAIASRAFDLAGRNVLELGAGTGLPSITAAKLGTPNLVVASDYDELETVRALKTNVNTNVSERIKVCGHIWGKNTEELTDCLPGTQSKFDSILLADCLWDPLSHADLLKTVTGTLSRTPEARVNVIAGLHTGRDKITGFIRRAHRAGLALAPIASSASWPPLPAEILDAKPMRSTESDEPLRHAAERIMELQDRKSIVSYASALLATAAVTTAVGISRSRNPTRRVAQMMSNTLRSPAYRGTSARTLTLRRAPMAFVTAGPSPSLARVGLSLVQRRFQSTEPPKTTIVSSLAEYEGPLARTFTRLKVFSFASLGLASIFVPVILLAPGEIALAGRIGLAATAIATSGVSTALIAWIGQPYVGRMRLLAASRPSIEADTVSWRLQPQVTTIFDPSFIRPTSRPFATWELTNKPPPSKETGSSVVAETVNFKTGKVVGQWIVKYTDEQGTIKGKVETVGKPVRYFNVHEELLDDSWRVLG